MYRKNISTYVNKNKFFNPNFVNTIPTHIIHDRFSDFILVGNLFWVSSYVCYVAIAKKKSPKGGGVNVITKVYRNQGWMTRREGV